MRGLLTFSICLALAVFAHSVGAQGQVFTSDKIEYTIELPSNVWRVLSEPDPVHPHTEFVYGSDRLEGYLQIRKEVVDAGTTPSELARRDLEQSLRYLPGFVEDGKEERFTGRLNGVTVTYYLQADNRTIYALRFSGLRDKLGRIRNQTDLIARSFRLK
jgi:hypothetical protein